MVITGTAGRKLPDSGQSRKDDPDQRAAHRTERLASEPVTWGKPCPAPPASPLSPPSSPPSAAGAVTTTPVTAATESHHVSASADGSINWDTAPASAEDSINWD